MVKACRKPTSIKEWYRPPLLDRELVASSRGEGGVRDAFYPVNKSVCDASGRGEGGVSDEFYPADRSASDAFYPVDKSVSDAFYSVDKSVCDEFYSVDRSVCDALDPADRSASDAARYRSLMRRVQRKTKHSSLPVQLPLGAVSAEWTFPAPLLNLWTPETTVTAPMQLQRCTVATHLLVVFLYPSLRHRVTFVCAPPIVKRVATSAVKKSKSAGRSIHILLDPGPPTKQPRTPPVSMKLLLPIVLWSPKGPHLWSMSTDRLMILGAISALLVGTDRYSPLSLADRWYRPPLTDLVTTFCVLVLTAPPCLVRKSLTNLKSRLLSMGPSLKIMLMSPVPAMSPPSELT